MLGAAAQPLLLFAQRHHFGAELLVRGPTHEPPVHVFGFDVGLDFMSVGDNKNQVCFCYS